MAVVLLAGCGGKARSSAPATTSDLPPGCEPKQVDAVVTGFLDAVTAGDRARLATLLPRASFDLYDVVDGGGASERRFRTRQRAAAIRYLIGRHAQHEHERLINLRVAPGRDANHASVSFTITRVADDFRPRRITNRIASGRATIDCVAPGIAEWAMAGP